MSRRLVSSGSTYERDSGFIVVSGFLDPRWRVEIEADAVVPADASLADTVAG